MYFDKNQMSNHTQLSLAEVDKIISVYASFCQAMIDCNRAMLEKLLPETYVAKHITGRKQSKKEWLDDIESGRMDYKSFSNTSFIVNQTGNRIVLNVVSDITASIYGSYGTWTIPSQIIFEKKDNNWQIVG